MAKKKKPAEEVFAPEDSRRYREAQKLADELQDRAPFSYDPQQDPLYRSSRDEAQRLGRQAMEDTMGKAAALTGGYGTSYALTAGQQAYNEMLTKLSALLPELYDRAKEDYDDETKDFYNRLGVLTGLYDREYQSYLDLMQAEQSAQAAAEQKAASEQARQDKARSEAYERAMQGLMLGVAVPEALLREAGIDKDYAERLRRYYAARQ